MLDRFERGIRTSNDGERLVPGESHDTPEVVRHKSSYAFFSKIISDDLIENPQLVTKGFTILDVGCGTGHGSFMLSQILNASVVGIEPDPQAYEYAVQNYGSPNIEYINCSFEEFIKSQRAFDYVVSRHALEHIVNGIELALELKVKYRLMVNVPYMEDDRNPFHLVHWIDESHFKNYPSSEIYYEDMNGATFKELKGAANVNSIVCVSSFSALNKVQSRFVFPVTPWVPEFLQGLGLELLSHYSKESSDPLKATLASEISRVRILEADCLRRQEELGAFIKESERRAREVDDFDLRLKERESALHQTKEYLDSLKNKTELEFQFRQKEISEKDAKLDEKLELIKAGEYALQDREQELIFGSKKLKQKEADFQAFVDQFNRRKVVRFVSFLRKFFK